MFDRNFIEKRILFSYSCTFDCNQNFTFGRFLCSLVLPRNYILAKRFLQPVTFFHGRYSDLVIPSF